VIHRSPAWFPLLAVCVFGGCALGTDSRFGATSLPDVTVVGSYVLPSADAGSSVPEELSGAWYDPSSRRLLVVSDEQDRPAILWMELEVGPGVRLTRASVIPVEPVASRRTLDLEGIAPARNGHLFVSSEGDDTDPDSPVPGIFEITREGRFVRRLALPEALAGMPVNGGLEGLSTSPDGRWLFTATEGSLRQDGQSASFDAGGLSRVLAYDLDTGGSPREYAYRTDPVPRLWVGPSSGNNGISEVLSVTHDELLVLERAYVEEDREGGRSANAIRLYRVELEASAEVTGRWSLLAAPPEAVLTKTLVLDLATFAGQLEARLSGLENFEAMALGPSLPDGRRTLLLISDNNRSASQVTAIVVLAVSARMLSSSKGGG
jgi:hypothetical protein